MKRSRVRVPLSAQREDFVFPFLCLSGSPALLPHSFPRLPAADKWEFVSEARHSLRGSVRLKDKGVAIATPLSFVVVQIQEPATFEALLFKGGFGRIVKVGGGTAASLRPTAMQWGVVRPTRQLCV